MGFLHNLWDETVAGPAPESGLTKLRKTAFSDRLSGRHALDKNPISRSITMLRADSVPSSPTTPTTPGSPFSRNLSNFVLMLLGFIICDQNLNGETIIHMYVSQ